MAYTFNTELKNVIYTYAQLSKIRLPKKRLERQIEESPYFPSLLSVGDVFDSYGIQNSAYRVVREDFMDLADEVPFIAFTRIDESNVDFVTVSRITSAKVNFYHKGRKIRSLETGSFQERFREIVWKSAEGDVAMHNSVEDYIKQEKCNKNLRVTAAAVIIASIVSFVGWERITTLLEPLSLYFFCKSFGLSIAGLIVIYELDKNNSFVKNLCTINSKTNCDAVLDSSGAKFFGFTWAEIGFSYFLSTVLILVNPSINQETRLSITLVLSCVASGYIIFSIYYQWRVVKQWCVLCLFIQMILLLELGFAITLLRVSTLSFDTQLGSILSLTTLFAFPLAVLFIFKPAYAKMSEHDLFRSAYKRLQYNPEIFNTQLSRQEKAAPGWQDIGITIGNPNAENTIIKICNPYCGPCSESHLALDKVIVLNNNINLKIIYISSDSSSSIATPVIKHLVAVRDLFGRKRLTEALRHWYESPIKDYNKFVAAFPIPIGYVVDEREIKEMREWCILANVVYTPTVYFNGYKLPENYKIEDVASIV